MSTVAEMRALAIAHAKRGDFGPASRALNEKLVVADPTDAGAWTRLARCLLIAREFEDGIRACEQAIALSQGNTIAQNLLRELDRAQIFAPEAIRDVNTAFPSPVFAVLGEAPGEEAIAHVGPRIETLLQALSDSDVARRIVDLRRSRGRQCSRLYRRNSAHWQSGHVYAFHHGGRWEPQFNVGVFSARVWPTNCFRAGIGFNLTRDGMDRDPAAGQERVLAYFAAFQRAIRTRWARHLVQWMKTNSGQIQFGDRGPHPVWTPERQVDWLSSLANPVEQGWVFVGRWWYEHNPDDASVLANVRQLSDAIEDAFRGVLPLWTDVWTNAAVD